MFSPHLSESVPPPTAPFGHERLLRLSDVIDRVHLSRTTIYRYVQKQDFPSPIDTGGGRVAWVESEVQAWIQRRIAASRTGETFND